MSAVASTPIFAGRYAIFDRIAAGGMAAVHVGRLVGQGGFARTVAVKRLHPQFALDPEFVAMFLDEARLAARIRHPNVVPTVDIVNGDGELFLVMEYVDGESFSTLLRLAGDGGERVPVDVAASVVAQALRGLHAAHEATSDLGEPLHIVHRDVSPQNILVGTDGVSRVLDFGVAKALGKLHTTREGQLKGKLGYLAPEQVLGQPVTRRSDVFAAAVVLWEALAGQRLFAAESEGDVLRRIMDGVIERPSQHAAGVPAAIEDVVMTGLAKEPADRFDTAMAMADAIESAISPAPQPTIARWLQGLAGDRLRARAELLASIESSSAGAHVPGAAAAAAPTLVDDAESSHTRVSVVTDREHLPPPRRLPLAWAVAGGIALGGGIATAYVVVHDSARAASRASAPPEVTVQATSPAPDAGATAAAVVPPAAEAASTPPSTGAPPPAPGAARPATHPIVHTPRPKPAPATAPPQGTGLYTRE
jgi:serine/threonine-protein kinase